MPHFDINKLENTKYQDLVKLAKEHNVYRRYAPKTELITKLVTISTQDTNVTPLRIIPLNIMDTSGSVPRQNGSVSKKKKIKTPHNYHSPQDKRSSVSHSVKVLARRQSLLNRQHSSPKGPQSVLQDTSSLAAKTPKLRRRTYEIENQEEKADSPVEVSPGKNRLKRQGTFDIEVQGVERMPELASANSPTTETMGKLRRQGTFDKEEQCIERIPEPSLPNSPVTGMEGKLRRQRTFDVLPNASDATKVKGDRVDNFPGVELTEAPTECPAGRLRRQGTFEMDSSSFEVKALSALKKMPSKKVESPHHTPRVSMPHATLTPQSVGPRRSSVLNSVPRAFITSRGKRDVPLKPPGVRFQHLKSPVTIAHPARSSPSVVRESQIKKAVVSAKKVAEASSSSKLRVPRKVPDFSAIHKKQFDEMESIVDVRQRVLSKANSVKKNVPKCAVQTPKPLCPNDVMVPAKKAVARKLISPKFSSKLVSPKPVMKQVATTSKVPSSEPVKLISTDRMSPGVSKLDTPKPAVRSSISRITSNLRKLISPKRVSQTLKSSPTIPAAGRPSQNTGSSRMEIAKAAITGKQPINRKESVTARSRHILKNVRLNKRFELQMQHRLKNM